AHVHGDVENRTLDDANELGLRVSDLEVESSERVRDGTRVVVLHERAIDPRRAVFLGLVGFEKESAVVAVDGGFDQQYFWKVSASNLHLIWLPCAVQSSERPRYSVLCTASAPRGATRGAALRCRPGARA